MERKVNQVVKTNAKWEDVHVRVKDGLLEYFDTYKRIPSIKALETLTGLKRTVIVKHLNQLSFEEYFQGIQQKMLPLCEDLIMHLYKRGIDGDVSAIKLFFQLLGWAEKRETKEKNTIEIIVKKSISTAVDRIEDATFTPVEEVQPQICAAITQ